MKTADKQIDAFCAIFKFYHARCPRPEQGPDLSVQFVRLNHFVHKVFRQVHIVEKRFEPPNTAEMFIISCTLAIHFITEADLRGVERGHGSIQDDKSHSVAVCWVLFYHAIEISFSVGALSGPRYFSLQC